MPKTKADTRIRLLQAAEKVTYERGFGSAALAHIAREAQIPLGNIYYYFKTKDEIGDAIVELRASRFRKLLQELDKAESPQERLCGFVDVKIRNREQLAKNGCPVGTLCSELNKEGSVVARKATVLFAEALRWMDAQFRAIGKGDQSSDLAVHLLSATQGVSVLAHTFNDPSLIERESELLKAWVRGL
jgi:TetR/AcrR family transcriptional regulator, transcriptional repressor for nem operon